MLLVALLIGLERTPPPLPLVLPAAETVESALPFWGAPGHRVVARLASSRLSAGVRAEVSRLLLGQSMADASTWADEIRNQRKVTEPWHYVDILITDSVYRPEVVCVKGCVISAIDSFTKVLANPKINDGKRREALRFLIHFIGDLHQPLHAGERGDRGGNDVKVRFLNRQVTLHALWDSRFIESIGRSEDEWFTFLTWTTARRSDLATIAQGTTVDWALESHNRARDVVYKFLPGSLQLSGGDLARAKPVIEESLLRAGVRLAAVLEKALGK